MSDGASRGADEERDDGAVDDKVVELSKDGVDADSLDGDDAAGDEAGTDNTVTDEVAEVEEADTEVEEVDPGETLFYESGGSWWVVLIGPILVGVVLVMELTGPGQVHWPVLSIFFVILTGFSLLQVYAARQHTSVALTERTLRQGTRTIDLDDIAKIYPANNSADAQDWESSPALGELSGVPRRRKGIGVKLESGKLRQAWARDDERFRSELTQAWQAVKMGL